MNETQKLKGPWPVLHATQDFPCDGVNPRNDEKCVLGHHRGFHRDTTGDKWLDDGDPARPDWYGRQPYDPRD
jgi:hypothetical protein